MLESARAEAEARAATHAAEVEILRLQVGWDVLGLLGLQGMKTNPEKTEPQDPEDAGVGREGGLPDGEWRKGELLVSGGRCTTPVHSCLISSSAL